MKTNSTITKRKLTPDLARGFMLLFIALAHANQFISSSEREITFTDQVTVFIRQVLIDGRAFPLFAILFGYGCIKYIKGRREKGEVGSIPKKFFDLEEHGC
jgi:uncharacterized protein